MGDLIEKLGIDPLLLVAQIVNFLILLYLLKRFLYKPVVQMLQKRSRRVEKSLAKAKQAEEDAARSQQEYDQKISAGVNEANQIVDKAKAEAEKVRAELIDKANNEAEKIMAKARLEMNQEKEKLMTELRQETADLATLVATRILSKDLDEAAQRRLIDSAMSEIDRLYSPEDKS